MPRVLLVVEDNDLVLEVIRATLNDTIPSLELVCATNGAEAEHAARRLPAIDVVLTDILLPDMSGVSVARTVLALHPAARVVLMTGWDGKLEEAAAELPLAGLLLKPFTTQELLAALDLG